MDIMTSLHVSVKILKELTASVSANDDDVEHQQISCVDGAHNSSVLGTHFTASTGG
jgi:ethanolamine utilization microcompartment shell protein EutL